MTSLADFRAATAKDVPFIRHSWVMSYCKHSVVAPDSRPPRGACGARMSSSTYVPEQHELIAKILQRASCVVACNAEDPDQIFGYLVFEKQHDRPCIHYLYVKEKFRKLGIAHALAKEAAAHMPEGPLWASHWSHLLPVVMKPAEVEFNPFRAAHPKGESDAA